MFGGTREGHTGESTRTARDDRPTRPPAAVHEPIDSHYMRVKLTALAVVSLALLTGCSFGGGNPRVAELAGQLDELPGVVSAEGEWTPGSFDFPASASVHVDLEPEVTADQVLAITRAWGEKADFGTVSSSLSLGFDERPSVTFGLTEDHLDAADALVPLWLDIADDFDVASVDAGSDVPDLYLRSAAMGSPSQAAATVEKLAASGGAEFGASTWFIGPTTAEGDSNDEAGVSVTSRDGLPDATALDYLATFDGPFLSAEFDGDAFLGFETLGGDDYRLAITLAPESLRDTPSNQLNDALDSTPTWQAALSIARVVQPTDSVSVSFSLFRNPPFAMLDPRDCDASTSSTDLGDRLWQDWIGFAATPDGSTAHSCA